MQDPKHTDAASRLVATLERTWTAIQHRHPDLPDVVIITGAGRVPGGLVLGHFAAHCWKVGDDDRHELFVGGEGLRRGARDVLATMLHEAGHGLASARNLKDTSRQGRYHNAKYKALAEELGIEVTHHPIMGYSTTTLPDPTAERYGAELAALERALTLHRYVVGIIDEDNDSGPESVKVTPPPDDPDQPSKRRTPVYECGCEEPRRLRMSKRAFEAGPITCGMCGEAFEDREDPEEAALELAA